MLTFLLQTPIPRDIPLPLPLPEWLLIGLLVFSFLLHILFVNLMVGGTLIKLWAKIKSLKDSKYDLLAKEIGKTITVNKSLAVVLGVAPLLSINALYTIYFYSSNSLTGGLWISIVPLVSIAFIMLYWHKYGARPRKYKPELQVAILAVPALIFLFVPLIFLTNINLMQFPEKWIQINNFWDAVLLWNVIPRYLHFITASFAVTGVFLYAYMRRKNYETSTVFKSFTKDILLKLWLRIAFYGTLLQLVFGPLVFFTLPWKGVTWSLAYIIIAGVTFAIIAMFLLWKSLKSYNSKDDNRGYDKNFVKIAVALGITVLFMGTGRQVYRTVVLEPHETAMQNRTEAFLRESADALAKFEAESNIENLVFKVDHKLDRFTRRSIYKKFEKDNSINDIKFDLEKEIIQLKYDRTKTDVNEIFDKVEALDYKIIKDFSIK